MESILEMRLRYQYCIILFYVPRFGITNFFRNGFTMVFFREHFFGSDFLGRDDWYL